VTPAEDHVRDDAVHVLGGHGEPITAVGFVLGGKLLVTGDAEGNVAAWKTPGFERHFELAQTPPAPVHCIAGGSRGDVYFGRGVAVKQWQTGAGFLTDFSQLQSFTLGEAHTREVVPVLSTAREVISGGYDGALCFWDPDSGDVRTGNLGSPILSLACTAGALHDRESGGLLAAGHEDGTVSILDLDACEPIGRYEAHARDVYALSFQNVVFNRQILLATVSPADAVVRLWKSSELVTEIAAPGFAVAFSPDGRFLAHGDGKEVVVRDGRDWQVVHRLRGHQHLISWLAFSPSARMEDRWDGWLASASHDGTVRIWSL
jgi:WD40 repeat protein